MNVFEGINIFELINLSLHTIMQRKLKVKKKKKGQASFKIKMSDISMKDNNTIAYHSPEKDLCNKH